MGMGFGADWKVWDEWAKQKAGPKFADPRYNNFELFKSPKGRWMVFYNTSYGDIKIWDVETGEPIIENFYSKDKYYASHTNVSSYVPTVGLYRSTYKITKDDGTIEENQFIHGNVMSEYEKLEEIPSDDMIFSAPIAYNAWTIWACDYEFFVDVLDLSRIDEGVLKVIDKASFVIPIDAWSVRDFVKADVESIRDDEIEQLYWRFKIIGEYKTDSINVNVKTGKIDPLEQVHAWEIDQVEATKEEKAANRWARGKYQVKDKLPWQELAERWKN